MIISFELKQHYLKKSMNILNNFWEGFHVTIFSEGPSRGKWLTAVEMGKNQIWLLFHLSNKIFWYFILLFYLFKHLFNHPSNIKLWVTPIAFKHFFLIPRYISGECTKPNKILFLYIDNSVVVISISLYYIPVRGRRFGILVILQRW